MTQTKILIADDHNIVRTGIKTMCQRHGYNQIDEVENCSELMMELKKKNYSHLILDINLSDGNSIEILPNILSIYPSLKVMIFSTQPAAVYWPALKRYGINYYLSKTSRDEDTRAAIKRFLENEQPVRESFEKILNSSPFAELTPRELEVLHYLVKGYTTKKIAEILNLKWSTISTLKSRLFSKTETDNQKELLELASLYKVV